MIVQKKRKKPSGWHLYILQCSDNTYYTGITNDLDRRLTQHNSGTASRYTRSRLPVALHYSEPCRGKSAALRKEYKIKNLTRKEKEEYMQQKTSCRTPVKRTRKY
jgi:putative endonuclease